MTPINRSSNLLLAFILIFPPGYIFSQTEATTAPAEAAALKAAVQTDQAAVGSLILYPPDIQHAIVEAAAYPEVVSKLAGIQATSKAAFRKYIEGLSREQQWQLYELTRYPGLIESIAAAKGDQPAVLKIVEKLPKEIGAVALQVGTSPDRAPILTNISALNKSVEEVAQQLLHGYPENTQAAFRILLAHPETLNILSEHMNLTVQLGALYKKDPAYLKANSTAAHTKALEKSASMLQTWKAELEKNPAAVREFKDSATEFAQHSGYDMKTAFAPPGAEDVAMTPYPYWFGYPYWDSEPRWYPVPPYYDWGWFTDQDGALNIVGLPSYAFVHWMLDDPSNVEDYPHLTDLFLIHYEGHPDSADSFTATVGAWLQDQKGQFPAKWFAADGNRAERLKEYGHLLLESGSNSLSAAQRAEYVEVHGDAYPGLNFNVKATPEELSSISMPPNIKYQSPSGRRTYYWAVDYQLSSWAAPYHQNLVTFSIPTGKK